MKSAFAEPVSALFFGFSGGGLVPVLMEAATREMAVNTNRKALYHGEVSFVFTKEATRAGCRT